MINCIYHSRDLDGWMSAAIVKMWAEKNKKEIEFIGWDYGNPLPEINPYKSDVIMVDISMPIHNMRHLQEKNNLVWIDHHVSAIKEMEEAALDPLGYRDSNYAACELTWKYLFGENIPEIVRLLGRYDCFGHKGTDEELKVLQFQYGARQCITDYKTAFNWLEATEGFSKRVENATLEDILTKGKSIYEYLCSDAKVILKRSFPIKISQYKFLCVNQDRFNPINFGVNYHKDGYDGFACFWYANGKWVFSLYNDNGKVDCSLIAKSFGGGGHKGAAGFTTEDISEFLNNAILK